MFIERNTFHLKFCAGKEALRPWSDYLHSTSEADSKINARLFTYLTGNAYGLVLELSYETYAELEPSLCRLAWQPGWKAFYERFVPLCQRGKGCC